VQKSTIGKITEYFWILHIRLYIRIWFCPTLEKPISNGSTKHHSHPKQIEITESQSTIEISQRSDSEVYYEDIATNSKTLQENLENTFLDFLIDLHTNSNLTKDIIHEILHKIKTEIVDQICPFVGIDDISKESIDNAFGNSNTQYKFEKKSYIFLKMLLCPKNCDWFLKNDEPELFPIKND